MLGRMYLDTNPKRRLESGVVDDSELPEGASAGDLIRFGGGAWALMDWRLYAPPP